MLDYIGIFKELNNKKIKYIVVGGLAVNLYGIPRMTYDIDLILEMGDKNLRNFLNLMNKWGFKPKAPVDMLDFLNIEKRENWIKNKNMRAFNLVNPDWAISEIDVIISTPIKYEEAIKRVKYIKVHNVSIPTISIDDLILMKKGSKRKQDREDIKYLKRIKNEIYVGRTAW